MQKHDSEKQTEAIQSMIYLCSLEAVHLEIHEFHKDQIDQFLQLACPVSNVHSQENLSLTYVFHYHKNDHDDSVTDVYVLYI